MRLCERLLVCFMCCAIVGQGLKLVRGDAGSDFLDYKEAQVRLIAKQSVINYDQRCDLVKSCSEPGMCTRGACLPLKDDALLCTPVLENKQCSDQKICNSIRANYNRSYVRYPIPSFSETVQGDVSSEVRDSICSQRMLDPTFIELHDDQLRQNQITSDTYFFNFYFGSIDGSFRFYPGLEVRDCTGYDPRTRPWYNGAIGVVKDVVVLLDTGASMSDKSGWTFETKMITLAQIMTEQLLMTLTAEDKATIISFDDSAEARKIHDSYTVPINGLNKSDTAFRDLLSSVNMTKVSQTSGPSNYTAGLVEAMSVLNQSSSPEALKVVILLTDGQSLAPSVNDLTSVIGEYLRQPIRLFIYQLTSDSSESLASIACEVEGHSENLDPLRVLQNPLFALNSYFSFLARSHVAETGVSKPFWQRIYTDYGNLGPIISVAYPAMSADGLRLIGVAGIDIQIAGLDPILRASIETSLDNQRTTTIASNVQGAKIQDCNATRFNTTLGSCSGDFSQPVCAKNDFTSSYKDLICCGECAIDGKRDSQTLVIAVITSLVSVFILMGGAFLVFRHFRARRRPHYLVDDIVKIPKYSYEMLSLATDRFSEENKLGNGTFGVVYLGTLESGERVAVKKLHLKPDHDLTDFEAEIRVLATANHNNLLALKGFCVGQQYILVYELVENGDLDEWLFEKPKRSDKVLPWDQRVLIAKGTARGLAYLHEELQNQQKVCHSDIKPANILLDRDFNPKVADFGMAKLYEGGADMYAVGGTLGYMAPEILEGGASSTKADVYSYGMVILEMVSGRRFGDSSVQNLRSWATRKVNEGNEMDVIDPLLRDLDVTQQEMGKRLISIALCCLQIDPDSRPEMSSVVKMIEGFLPVPSRQDGSNQQLYYPSEATKQPQGTFQWDKSWTISQAILHSKGSH